MSTEGIDGVPPGMLNPFAPEAWSPVGDAMYRTYIPVSVACLSIILWDILTFLSEEIELLFRRRFTPSKCFYLGARLASLGFMIAHAVLVLQQHENCQPWVYVVATMYAITNISVGAIFLFRVKAVYSDVKWFQRVMEFAWTTYAASTVLNFVTTGIHIGPSKYCIADTRKPFLGIMFATQAVYDILVCSAITYKLCYDVAQDDHQPLHFWWTIWTGRNPFLRLRKRLLQDSQAYFIIVIMLKIAQIAIFFDGNPVLMVISGLLDITMFGILSTKIYRKFNLGVPGIVSGPNPTLGTLGTWNTDSQRKQDASQGSPFDRVSSPMFQYPPYLSTSADSETNPGHTSRGHHSHNSSISPIPSPAFDRH